MTKQEINQLIKDAISDLVMDFEYYDRKEDEELTMEVMYTAFKDGTITLDECVEAFRENMEGNFPDQGAAARGTVAGGSTGG